MVDLAGLALFDQLELPTREWLASIAVRRDYCDGELIHNRGETDVSMGIVISGQIKLVRLRQNGSQSLVSTISPGQHFADITMLNKSPRTHTAIALGAATIDHFDQASFERILARPDVMLALYRCAGQRLTAAISMVDDLRTLPREIHLAKLLLAIAPAGNGIEPIEVVQEDLAALLGISTMTLGKALACLKREGLIETGYRKVSVPRQDLLRSWLQDRTSC
jgi:CRP/FNR family cyclic AMP-dependent transcriptional regulator